MRGLLLFGCLVVISQVAAATDEAFSSFSRAIAERRSLHCELVSTRTVEVKGNSQITTSSAKLWLKRPNKLLFVSQTPAWTLLSCSNGTSRTIFRPALNRYVVEKLNENS